MSPADGRGPARLEIEDLVVSFGGVRAVDDVSLVAEPGRIVGLIGPNGSGKTTLLDAVSGLVSPSAGHVRVDGEDLAEYLPEERITVGMVRSFQDCRLFPELSVEDTLLLCEDARRDVRVLSTTLQMPWARRAEREKQRAVDDVIDVVRARAASAAIAPPSSRPARGGSSTSPRSCSPARACCCSTSRPPGSRNARPRRSSRCCAGCTR